MGAAVSCPTCVAPNDDDDTTCFRCGSDLGRVIACPYCGADVLSRKNICPSCGTAIHPHTDEWGNAWEAGDPT